MEVREVYWGRHGAWLHVPVSLILLCLLVGAMVPRKKDKKLKLKPKKFRVRKMKNLSEKEEELEREDGGYGRRIKVR